MSEPQTTFDELGLDPRLLKTLADRGYEKPTPIQAAAIPPMLGGADVIGRARTGSGKTAAFGLPLLHKLRDGAPGVRALVLTPTRELTIQVAKTLDAYSAGLPVKCLTIYGGSPYPPQLDGLRRGAPIVVGTPGRLIDHLDRGSLDLSKLELLVVDEADEMLRMGFIDDVEKILGASPDQRQIALFSATMPPPIQRIANRYLKEPQEIQVESRELATGHIEQRWMRVPDRMKLEALRRVLATEDREGTLVFARTKVGCAELADRLAERGIAVDALHGDLSQSARELVLKRLRKKRIDVVIATDVAARGIDVEHLTHVINLDFPRDPESYVHRIGRTGRAGRDGTAISFVTPTQVRWVARLSKTLGVRIEPMVAPSDAQIHAKARSRIAGRLLAGAEGPPATLIEMAKELLASRPAEELIASALAEMSAAEGLTLRDDASDEPPVWSRARAPRERDREDRGPRRDEGNFVDLFLPTGKTKGVRPKDLVGALTNELGVPIGAIGKITIGAFKTFIGISPEVAADLLEQGAVPIRGVKIPISKARPRGQVGPPRHSGPPRSGNRPPPRAKPRKGKRGDR